MLNANDIVPDPSVKGTLYVATDMGVFVTRTENAGKWELLGSGMPLCPVTDLRFHKATRKLVAATFGRSMYYTNLPAVVSPTLEIEDIVANLSISPSPMTTIATIHFNLKSNSPLQLDIVDLSGRVVKTLMKGSYTEGGYQPTISRHEIDNAGIYLCRLTMKNKVKTLKFMVL